MNNLNIMLVGVGGQGTLLASRVLGNVALKQSFDVKVSEVHGMSQRGGSVVTYVKMGPKVYSPLIEKGKRERPMSFWPSNSWKLYVGLITSKVPVQ